MRHLISIDPVLIRLEAACKKLREQTGRNPTEEEARFLAFHINQQPISYDTVEVVLVGPRGFSAEYCGDRMVVTRSTTYD